MKKYLVTIVLVCMVVSAMAVEIPKQGFGLHIGYAQPILRLNTNTSKDSLATVIKMNGFKVGLVYDASYAAGFGSSMGINYTFATSNSGWKSKNAYGMDYPRSRQMITYHEFEVFVDWQYKFEIAKETYLMLYSGPSIQCGIAMDMRVDKQDYEGQPTDTKRYNGYVNDVPDQLFKRINVTWGVGAGFQYQRYFVRGGYDFGLIVPYKNADFQNGNHTRGRLDQWNVKIGMYLWYE